jgi:hypothetical protein
MARAGRRTRRSGWQHGVSLHSTLGETWCGSGPPRTDMYRPQGSHISIPEAYKVQLRRGSSQPEHVLWAEGVETLEFMKPRAKRENSMILQPDVIIGWRDWVRLKPFMISGWTIPGVPVGAAAPASNWHLRVNLGGQPAGVPQRAVGSAKATDHHRARGRCESGANLPLILHDICEESWAR